MRKVDIKEISLEEKVTLDNQYEEEIIKIENIIPTYVDITQYAQDEKSLTKLIKKIEQTIRTSYEYKEYIRYLKDYMQLNHCSFFRKIDKNEIPKVTIELHHCPFTLFDICLTIFEKWVNKFKKSKIFVCDLANEVMKLHYEGLVGLVPLSITAHEMVHAGEIFIPLSHIYGNYEKFFINYKPYIGENLLEKYNQYKNDFDLYKYNTTNKNILKKRFKYLEIDGYEFPAFIKKREEKKKEKIIENAA